MLEILFYKNAKGTEFQTGEVRALKPGQIVEAHPESEAATIGREFISDNSPRYGYVTGTKGVTSTLGPRIGPFIELLMPGFGILTDFLYQYEKETGRSFFRSPHEDWRKDNTSPYAVIGEIKVPRHHWPPQEGPYFSCNPPYGGVQLTEGGFWGARDLLRDWKKSVKPSPNSRSK